MWPPPTSTSKMPQTCSGSGTGNTRTTQHLPSAAWAKAAPHVLRCAPQDAIRRWSAQHKSTRHHFFLSLICTALTSSLSRRSWQWWCAWKQWYTTLPRKQAKMLRAGGGTRGLVVRLAQRCKAGHVHATGRGPSQKRSAHFFKVHATNSCLTCPRWPSMRPPRRARPAAGRRAPAPASAVRAAGGSRCCRSRCAAAAARRSTGAPTGPRGSRCGGRRRKGASGSV